MAQLLISCFSVVLLCVTWIATSTGEDVLDNLGVEAHPFQEEGPLQDDFRHDNSTGNVNDERDVAENVVTGDSPFILHNTTDGQDIPATEVESQSDGEKIQESAAQSRSDGEDAEDVLDALSDDVEEHAEVDEPKWNKTDGERGELNTAQSSAGSQKDSLDLFKPNNSSKKLEEQAKEVSNDKADEQTVTPHSIKDILDLLDMDDDPEDISNDESETGIKRPEISENVENAYNLQDKDKERQQNISEFVDRSAFTPADTTQTDYNKYFNKIDGEGGDQEEDYEDSDTESEDFQEEYADYFSDDDEGDDSINLGDNDDEKNNDRKDESAERKTESSVEDAKLAAFVSSHLLSEIPSNTTGNHQSEDYEDEEEDNISKESEENADKGKDTEENIPQTENQKEEKVNDNDDDDDDDDANEEDDYHRIPDYGAGGNYEEDDWYYDPLRNGAYADKTTQETPNDNNRKTGVSPHVGVAETNEGGLAAHDIQPKKQLAGPTGMILLYTALIVLFIAGIVVITVWKQPFHGWLRTRGLPSKGVLPADEGKRLLDHPFV
ncbi:clumping factor A-like isoform X2 [Pomacea canaliculata]|uniref:clumping factor A-like isoform X2 n=1 Tax=Pomacea canaliculata TaxID=400727 RepID=UPI000D72A1BD|nr:clumping factor A-like isoform X2 [Pomacea canaliculata]